MPWLMTSDEASLRRCTAAVAVTFVGLVSARLLAQAITLWTAQREDTIALRTAERFRSRVSDICQHVRPLRLVLRARWNLWRLAALTLIVSLIMTG